MRIKNKIIISFIFIILIVIIIFTLISNFLENNYQNIKFDKAYEYRDTHNITSEEYANYLINKGFIVTNTQIDNFQNLVCHEGEIIGYENGDPVFYATINENIIDDFLVFLDYILGIILIVIITLMLMVYYIFNKLIIKRVEILEDNMSKYSTTNKIDDVLISFKVDDYKDEINSLEKKFKLLLREIDSNQKSKQKLIVALSHELKSPLTKIDAILKMYSEDITGYDDKDKVINMLNLEVDNMSGNVQKLLEFYKKYELDSKKKEVNILEEFQRLFADSIFSSKNITFQFIEEEDLYIKVEYEKLNIILNNIKSNIYNHCEENTKVKVFIKDKKVTLENKIKEQKITSTKVGNIINDYLAQDINIKIEKEKEKDIYITKILF